MRQPLTDYLHLASGKVRELYRIDDDHLLFVASDRISAFDYILQTEIPDKGRILTAMSVFFLDFIRDRLGAPNHLAGPPDDERIPAAVLRTTYTNRFNGVFEPSVAITALRLNSPDLNTMPSATLQALSVTSSDRIVLGNKLEMKLGSELQTIQFMGRVHAFKPFGSADLHITPNTVLEYQYASSVPSTRLESRLGDDRAGDDRFESASSDLSEIAPRMSIADFSPAA